MRLKLDSCFRRNDKIIPLVVLALIVFTATLLLAPSPTQAGILPACAATGACQVCDVVTVFVTLGKWLITGAGGLALLVIVWAAFGMVTSAGNAEKVGAAKKQITGAIFGLGITLVAFQLVSMLIAILTVPSSNQSFSAQTSQETGKFASLTNFLGIPWWEICSVKGLRTAGTKYEKDINYRGTDVCRYWGDGTPCQTLSSAEEQKLVDCQALEGLSDLTETEKKTQEEKCKDIKVLRCCSGTCSDKECVTKKITQPIAESSTAYKEQASMLAAPVASGSGCPLSRELQTACKWQDSIKAVSNAKGLNPCVLTTIVANETIHGNSQDIGYDTAQMPGEQLNLGSGDNFFGLIGLKSDASRSVCKTGCSRGIGLTQITIFPKNNDWDGNTPAREIDKTKYKITDLLKSQTSLELAAYLFIDSRDNMATRWQRFKMTDDLRVEYAFAGYNGGVPSLNNLIKTINGETVMVIRDGKEINFAETKTYKRMKEYMRESLFLYNLCLTNGS